MRVSKTTVSNRIKEFITDTISTGSPILKDRKYVSEVPYKLIE
jgi:hypothetical protein